jgi:TolB-like protein/Tfp pilus assembly protein PilF
MVGGVRGDLLALAPHGAYYSPKASAGDQMVVSGSSRATSQDGLGMLQLHVLGSPSVDRGNRPCGGAAGQRKSLALLALLAVAGGRGLSRDKILAWLWPEIPADKATHRLAQLLYSLRRDLQSEELFLATPDLRLNPLLLTSDLAEFTAALEAGDFPRAVAAYGGAFLDGFYLSGAPDFERWVEEERTRLQQRHAAALEEMARAAARRGEVVAAAGWWRQLSETDPLNSRVAVSYMDALCAAGDRPSALRFVRTYETLLREQFDLDPDPTVIAAAEQLRSRPAESPVIGTPPAPAIAVLPLVNLTPEGENQYFSDGLTEELINALTRMPGLRVASRTSAYAFQGKGLDARQIGERLGVSALVEGSVRKIGNRVRLSARLIDVADGCQLWSETYERTMQDVFALQEELARSIITTLPLATRAPESPLSQRPKVLEAYTLYLRGRYAANKRTPEALTLAIEYLEQAVELDPGYAPAHAALAECCALVGFVPEFGNQPWPEAAPRARAAALEALRLDPRLPQAYAWLGVIHFLYDWDWAAAEAAFRKALRLDPNHGLAETWYAVFLGAMGRFNESLPRILHAEAVEPLSLQVRLAVCRCYFFARQYDQAHRALMALLKDEPGHPLITNWLGQTLCMMGRHSEALEVLERLPQSQQTAYVRSVKAHALAGLGRADEAQMLCNVLEQEFRESRVSGLYLSCALALLGERDHAMQIVEHGVRRRDQFIPWLLVQPAYDPVRNLPRFQQLLAELRLAPAAEIQPVMPVS